EGYGCAHVAGVEHVFHREHVGCVALQQLAHAVVDLAQARGEGIPRLRANHPAFDQRRAGRIVRANDAIPGQLSAGIDAEHDHALAAMSATSMSKLAHTFCTSSSSSISSMSLSSVSAVLPSTLTVLFGTMTTGSASTKVIFLASRALFTEWKSAGDVVTT